MNEFFPGECLSLVRFSYLDLCSPVFRNRWAVLLPPVAKEKVPDFIRPDLFPDAMNDAKTHKEICAVCLFVVFVTQKLEFEHAIKS
jgi:hypothetical protein